MNLEKPDGFEEARMDLKNPEWLEEARMGLNVSSPG